MTTTLTPAPRQPAQPTPEAAPSEHADARSGRARWPVFGALGAAAAFASTAVSMPSLEEDEYALGEPVLDKLDPARYRLGFLVGMVAVGLLFVAASGWKRWAEARAPQDLAARTIGQGLAATATVSMIFYGIMGSMGLYLDGGAEEGGISRSGQFVNYTLLDFGSLLAWWGAAVAAVCVAVLAFRKDRLLPRWMGIVTVPLLGLPLGTAIATSLPGLVGLVLPIWLVVISLGMVFSKTADAAA